MEIPIDFHQAKDFLWDLISHYLNLDQWYQIQLERVLYKMSLPDHHHLIYSQVGKEKQMARNQQLKLLVLRLNTYHRNCTVDLLHFLLI